MKNITRLLLTSDFAVTVTTKKTVIMTDKNVKIEISGPDAKKANAALAKRDDLLALGFELKEFDDTIEKIHWYERVLVPGNQSSDPVVLCYGIDRDEFYFDNIPDIRFREIERAELLCKAFAGLKMS